MKYLPLILAALVPLFLRAEFTVSVVDDDSASVAAIRSVKQVADEAGVKVTFAPFAANLEHNPEVAAELRRYRDEGHEIANHSYSHSPAVWVNPGIPAGALKADVEKADEIFRKEGFKPTAFVYPYGKFKGPDYRRKVFEAVGARYPIAFNARGDVNLQGATHPLYVSRHALRRHNSLMMEKRLVREAAEKGGWLVFLTHSANGDFSAARLRVMLEYAKSLGARILPVTQAAEGMKFAELTPEQLPEFTRVSDAVEVLWMHVHLVLLALLVAALIAVLVYFAVRKPSGAKADVAKGTDWKLRPDGRHYGLDFLRVLAMFFIVTRHGVFQSGVTLNPDASALNYYIGVFVNDFTAIAVNCFILITGYFMSKQEFRPRRLLRLWLAVLFYSVVTFGVWTLLCRCPGLFELRTELRTPGLKDAVKAVFPICGYTYWFVTLYFVLMLVTPILNAAAGAFRNKSGTLSLVALVFFFSVLPSTGIDIVGADQGYSFGAFVLLYLVGAWMRTHHPLRQFRARAFVFAQRAGLPVALSQDRKVAVFGYLAMLCVSMAYLAVKKVMKARGIELIAYDDYNFLPTFLASLFAFKFFETVTIGWDWFRRTIAFLAPLMIGVYLFHDNVLKHVLWHDVFDIDRFLGVFEWVYEVPLRIAAVFLLGCAVEWGRRRLFGLFSKSGGPS